jgi:hygromycin-B 7''-O-kinase
MIYPLVADPDTWTALHAQPPAIWAPALESLGRAWNLGGAWERLTGGEDSVVFAQRDTVVKLVPPFSRADADQEVSALQRLALSVPTPRVEDVRHEEGWTAIRMTRLGGAPAERVWTEVGREDRARIVTVVGSVLREIGRIEICDGDGDASALLARLRSRVRRHEADGFPDPEGFVRRHLPDPPSAPVLIHFDLNDGNLMLERRGGRWEVSGVLDFVTCRAFYAPMDLVTPAVFLCRGDPVLLRALVDGAGLAHLDPRQLAAWYLVHPFSQLRRDLAMGRREPAPPSEAALVAWWSRR